MKSCPDRADAESKRWRNPPRDYHRKISLFPGNATNFSVQGPAAHWLACLHGGVVVTLVALPLVLLKKNFRSGRMPVGHERYTSPQR